MPAYPALRAAFVHVPKTAGGAIEAHLAPWAAPRPRAPWPKLESRLPRARPPERARLRGHDTAAWMRVRLGTAVWAAWTTFAVIRNPYDRLISAYEFERQTPRHHRHARTRTMGFEDWLAWRGDKGQAQARWLTDARGAVIVDRLIAFERLEAELPPLFESLGVPTILPGDRARNTSEKAAPETYLTPGAIAAINRVAAEDFGRLGYRRIARAGEYAPRDPPAAPPASQARGGR